MVSNITDNVLPCHPRTRQQRTAGLEEGIRRVFPVQHHYGSWLVYYDPWDEWSPGSLGQHQCQDHRAFTLSCCTENDVTYTF